MRREFITVLFASALALTVRGQQTPPPAAGLAGAASARGAADSRMRPGFLLASEMNTFCLSAGAMTDRAIEAWAGAQFQAKSSKELRH